ncbi:T9SS type A sorting domain-containing protein, partial [bacterium]|nr:T9SS type A sorting domain-containing protein [bacterium]
VIDESRSNYRVIFVNPAGIGETKLPKQFDFSAYPNPFNGVVLFTVSLPEAASVSLDIYDLSGRRVASIANNYFEAGIHRLRWNGKADDGADLSSGIYLYRIETAKNRKTIKGVYLK